jgi:serine/threonine protein kinase
MPLRPGAGASGVVKKAVHVPSHRFIALKIMTVFEKEKRRQMINEMRTLCDSPRQPGLVSFFGAFYTPETNQISIALEYIEGGSLVGLDTTFHHVILQSKTPSIDDSRYGPRNVNNLTPGSECSPTRRRAS